MKYIIASSLLIAAISADNAACVDKMSKCASPDLDLGIKVDIKANACKNLNDNAKPVAIAKCFTGTDIREACDGNESIEEHIKTSLINFEKLGDVLKVDCTEDAYKECKDACDKFADAVASIQDSGSASVQVTVGASLIGFGLAAWNNL